MCLYICHPDSDGEDSATESKSKVLVVPPKQMSSALGSLLANYGSTSDSDDSDEPEGKRASTNVNKSSNTKSSGTISVPALLMVVKCPLLIILRLRSSVSAISIQRTKDLLQENQALLHSVPATNQDTSRSTSTVPFSEMADTPKFYQQNSLPNTPQNRRGGRGGRGRGRRGGRGEHQHAQPRRPTLLEMVKTPISSMHFTLYEFSLLR